MNVAPRVSLPYVDLSGVIKLWADECEAFIVYEHVSDTTVKKTHCHFLMLGCAVGPEQMKNIAKRVMVPGKGQAFWKWESKLPPDQSFITYMSKGKLAPKFVKNISPAEVEEWRLKWVDPAAKSNSSEPGNVYIINKKPPPKTISRKELLAEMTETYILKKYNDTKKREIVQMICQIVRKYGFGINPYHVREYYYALVWDQDDLFNFTTEKCLSLL